MNDREKVILGIENCITTDSVTECRKTKCPFIACRESCLEWLLRSALSLLKAQEPKLVPDIAEAMLGYRPKVRVGHCPSCGVLMSETDKFCRKCGQAVKWE